MSIDLEALRRRYDGVNHCWDCGGVIVSKRDTHGSFEACGACGAIYKVTGILRKDDDPDVLTLIDEVTTLRAQLAEAKALRLGRAPKVRELKRHLAAGGWWMLQMKGEDLAGWQMEDTKSGTVADFKNLAKYERDAIPLDADRQPCPIGGWPSEEP